MHTTLLVMAAGMGSRFGGNKQVARLGPHGEILLHYSIYDAAAAGFDKVVFVIKRAMEVEFRQLLEGSMPAGMEVAYAFQEFDNLPGGFTPPEGRVKPYGTVHAVLAAKALIHEPFAVINADDYYGKDAFVTMAESLRRMQGRENVASMVAYRLCNTVSENGTVTRGVCERDGQGQLRKVTETYGIKPFPDGSIRAVQANEAGVALDPDALVSMNFWGLTPWFFDVAERDLVAFLASDAGDPLKKECVLPNEIDRLMHTDGLTVEVLHTNAVWFGVTYLADKAYVEGELAKLHAQGMYPALV
ncbi:MAG: NTP transferase domain-containing protein [Clostridiales bacterium]|nr:NTP transferase domain-containing protein [Clostridiales bacterium]